jgi:chromosome segregation ATPase
MPKSSKVDYLTREVQTLEKRVEKLQEELYRKAVEASDVAMQKLQTSEQESLIEHLEIQVRQASEKYEEKVNVLRELSSAEALQEAGLVTVKINELEHILSEVERLTLANDEQRQLILGLQEERATLYHRISSLHCVDAGEELNNDDNEPLDPLYQARSDGELQQIINHLETAIKNVLVPTENDEPELTSSPEYTATIPVARPLGSPSSTADLLGYITELRSAVSSPRDAGGRLQSTKSSNDSKYDVLLKMDAKPRDDNELYLRVRQLEASNARKDADLIAAEASLEASKSRINRLIEEVQQSQAAAGDHAEARIALEAVVRDLTAKIDFLEQRAVEAAAEFDTKVRQVRSLFDGETLHIDVANERLTEMDESLKAKEVSRNFTQQAIGYLLSSINLTRKIYLD